MTNYPKQIYISNWDRREITDPTARENLEKAYDYGKASVESLDGWSNLTQAIKEEADIDWVKLDGLPAKCVHPEMGTLTYKLERDSGFDLISPYAYTPNDYFAAWTDAVVVSWIGDDGWNLYIKGEIPLKRKTADQLPNGTCIDGVVHGGWCPMKGVVVGGSNAKNKFVIWGNSTMAETAEKVEVLKEYGIGTFLES